MNNATVTGADILADVNRMVGKLGLDRPRPRQMIVMHERDYARLPRDARSRPGYFKGSPVHVVRDSVERRQVRFPRSKRRRIRKKWAARDHNFETRLIEAQPRPGTVFRVPRAEMWMPPLWGVAP